MSTSIKGGNRRLGKSVATAAIVAAACVVPARAASTWKGSTGGTTANPVSGNWSASPTTWDTPTPSGGTSTQLIFGGSGSTPYTSTDNISNSSHGFTIDLMTLNSSASVTETITGGVWNLQGTNHAVQQNGSGAFNLGGTFDNTETNNATTFTFSGNGSGLVTISGIIQDQSSNKNLSLEKTGTSTFVLTNTNNVFSGTLAIRQGTLRVNSINATATNLQPLGIATSAITMGADGAATFDYSGAGAATINRGFTVSANSATISSTGGTLTLGAGNSAAVGVGANALAFSGNVTVNSVISSTGAGSVSNNGSGTLTLTANNTFTGTLNINSGTLSVATINATATTAQPLGQSSAAFNLGSASAAIFQYTGSAVTLNRSININGAGGGTIRSTTGLLTLGSNVTGNGNAVTFDGAGGITLTGGVSGTGTSLTKNDAATLTLNGASNYTGATTVNAGTMTVSTTGSLSGTSSVTVANGATFNVNGNGTLNSSAALTVNGTAAFTRASQTVASLSDSGAGTRSLSLTGTAFNVTNASSFSGNISGTGSLVKNTSGTLTLSGSNNSYSGTTTVSAGTLKIDGTVASAAGAFTIGNGSPSTGTLEGTNGNIHRTVNMNSGGTVSPGGNVASSAILADNLNLNGGSTYIVNITDSLNPATSAGIGYDTLTVANTLAINATGVGSDKITITVLAGAVNHWNPVKGNQFFTIATSNALTSFNASKFVLDVSNFQQHNQTYPNYSWQVQQAGNDIRIAYVPEPGSAMLLGGAAIALLSARRRRTA